MRKFCAVVLILLLTVLLTGCGGRQLIDTTWRYSSAMVKMPDGSVVSGRVSSWNDYGDGINIQVVIDGVVYYTHSANVVLIAE